MEIFPVTNWVCRRFHMIRDRNHRLLCPLTHRTADKFRRRPDFMQQINTSRPFFRKLFQLPKPERDIIPIIPYLLSQTEISKRKLIGIDMKQIHIIFRLRQQQCVTAVIVHMIIIRCMILADPKRYPAALQFSRHQAAALAKPEITPDISDQINAIFVIISCKRPDFFFFQPACTPCQIALFGFLQQRKRQNPNKKRLTSACHIYNHLKDTHCLIPTS